jgi:hypothetical protein
MVAVPRRIMKDCGASLSDDQVRITGALEFLVRGYWGPYTFHGLMTVTLAAS